MKFFQWHFGLYLIPLAFLLPVSNTQAALSVTCEASMNTVNFGTITGTNANNASTTGTLKYNCTNTGDTAGYVSVCLAVDGGGYRNNATNPRYMERNGNTNPLLAFNMTHSGSTLWTTRGRPNGGSEFSSGSLAIAANSSVSRETTINISMVPGQGNSSSTSGVYSNNFDAGHTALTFRTSTTSPAPTDCTTRGGEQGQGRFPFIVQAAIAPSCAITATSNVNIGTHSATETNITGSNSSAITVNCTNGGAYYIGLAPSPSNGVVSNVGAGVMSGTGGNLDKVPYQLRSTVGINGTIWGNTATSTTVGNGMAGFGTGSNKTHEVFVTVPSADFKPDNYSDTVTIRVNY